MITLGIHCGLWQIDHCIPFSSISRAETILSGVIVRPDPKDPNSTRMSLMLQNDIKGWIPHFIVNLFVGKYSYSQTLSITLCVR